MDLKFALRSLRNNPSFTILAILVMALGIGANTAMFSVVNAVLLKPLDYTNPDRIVSVLTKWSDDPVPGNISIPDFNDWHHQSTAFSAMAYYDSYNTSAMTGRAAEYTQVARVSPEFFSIFSLQPVVGRLFSADEQKQGSGAAVLISYSYWQSHFAGNARALGQQVRMFDHSLSIVGILPPRFHYPDKTDIWFPTGTIIGENENRGAHNYRGVGLLKPAASLRQAQTQLSSIAAVLRGQFKQTNTGVDVAVTRLRDTMVMDVEGSLYLLLGAVALVLLIACANIATLLLARATARTREIAVRAAIGASRVRIVRQLITEGLLLSLLSGGVGVLLAVWGVDPLVKLAPSDIPRLTDARIDGWVLAFTFTISIIASLLFGLAPALHASRVDLNEALKQGATRSVLGGAAGRLRSGLVVAEIAFSMLLLAGAGLLIKSFVAIQNVRLGFRPDHVVVMQTSVPVSATREGRDRAIRFYQGLLPQLSALRGISFVGATNATPGSVASDSPYSIDHEQYFPDSPDSLDTVIAPGTFAALGIQLKRGRDFSPVDTPQSQPVAIINKSLARKAFPGKDPVGHIIFCAFEYGMPMKIVGIVEDVRQSGPTSPPERQLYAPYSQHPFYATSLSVVARTPLDPSSLWQPMRRIVQQRFPEVSVKFTTLETLHAEIVAPQWFRTLLLGIFAALAVCLAMAGVYGVMAYMVGQRSSEIGLRMALGATPADVSRLMLRQASRLTAAGLVIGLIGSLAASRLITNMLFEVRPTDPGTYAIVAVLLAVAALSASYLPARRASRLDPLTTLRT
jgi:predicted permease